MNIYETMSEKVAYPFYGKSTTHLNTNEEIKITLSFIITYYFTLHSPDFITSLTAVV